MLFKRATPPSVPATTFFSHGMLDKQAFYSGLPLSTISHHPASQPPLTGFFLSRITIMRVGSQLQASER